MDPQAQGSLVNTPATPPTSHIVVVHPAPLTVPPPAMAHITGGPSWAPEMCGAEPGQQAGTGLQPRFRRPVSVPNCSPASIQVSSAVSPFGVPLPFITELNVELDRLLPFEVEAAKMKLKRLWQVKEANHQIEQEIQQKQAVIARCLSPGTPVFVKVFDDLLQNSAVLRVNAEQGAADIERMITAQLGRHVVLSIQTRTNKVAPFNHNSLRDAQGRIACKEALALKICAQ
jgi:hypothetical protein